jgi:hypothetical protein
MAHVFVLYASSGCRELYEFLEAEEEIRLNFQVIADLTQPEDREAAEKSVVPLPAATG